ncbi:hypothetical protein ACP275_08G094700 [Erythranthe tilingii]
MDSKIYRSLVGSLIYLTSTRPDIVHSVTYVSRYMSEPNKLHFAAAKRILRYLQGTKKQGLKYEKEENNALIGSRIVIGQVIGWSSKKQKTVALSSSEAEYIAAADAACEAVWLRRILSDLQEKQVHVTTIFCGNMSTIAMTKNPIFHARSKHIELRHHFIRDLVDEEEISMKFVNPNDQVADFLTKAVTIEKLEKFKKKLKIMNSEGVLKILIHIFNKEVGTSFKDEDLTCRSQEGFL